MIHGLHRTKSSRDGHKGDGWRLLLPIFPMWRRGYDVSWDQFITGWWWCSLGISLEVLSHGSRAHGMCVRLTWGWTTSALPPPEPA